MRIYNPALGRFLSVDPIAKEFAWNSSYAFAENSPIMSIDLDGAEKYHFQLSFNEKTGEAILTHLGTEDIRDRVWDWSSLGMKTEINQRVEYVVHTGQFHTGAVNGTLYSQEITFNYSNATEFVREAKDITPEEIQSKDDALKTGDAIAAGFQNIGEEYKSSRPGRGRDIPITKTALNERAKFLHGKIPNKIAQNMRTTAITQTTNDKGDLIFVVGRLAPQQRAALASNEVEASGMGHAEATTLNYSKKNNLTPISTAASRPICTSCQEAIKTSGSSPASALKKK